MVCGGGTITGAEGGYTSFTFSAKIVVELLIMLDESPVVLFLSFLGGEGGQVGRHTDTFRRERSKGLAFLSRMKVEPPLSRGLLKSPPVRLSSFCFRITGLGVQ